METLTDLMARARAAEKSADLARYEVLMSRSHEPKPSDGEEMIGIQHRQGIAEAQVILDEAKRLQELADQQAAGRRNDGYVTSAAVWLARERWKCLSDVPELPDAQWAALGGLMTRICIDAASRIPLTRADRISSYLMSRGWENLALTGWQKNGVPSPRDVAVEREFSADYRDLISPLKQWREISPLPMPEAVTDEMLSELQGRVDALPPADPELFPLACILADGYALYVAPIPAGLERDEIQRSMEAEIVRINSAIIARMDVRRRQLAAVA